MKFEYPKTVSLFSLVLLFSVASASAIEEPVQLISGQVSGVDLDSGVQVFRGDRKSTCLNLRHVVSSFAVLSL